MPALPPPRARRKGQAGANDGGDTLVVLQRIHALFAKEVQSIIRDVDEPASGLSGSKIGQGIGRQLVRQRLADAVDLVVVPAVREGKQFSK